MIINSSVNLEIRPDLENEFFICCRLHHVLLLLNIIEGLHGDDNTKRMVVKVSDVTAGGLQLDIVVD